MKKIFITITLFFVLSAVSWSLEPYAYGSLGAMPNFFDFQLDTTESNFWWDTTLGVGLRQQVKDFTFYGEVSEITEMTKIVESHTWKPITQEYKVNIGIIFKAIGVHYEHSCYHGVDQYNPRSRTYDKFYIDFDTRRITWK